MPKVSVIIPTYNCAKYLPEAIQSVLNQTYQDFEIIVVDDGSVDNTKEIVKEFIKNYPNKIKYIYQENKGHATARNTAIRNSIGEYIAMLDADDLCTPRRLEKEVHILETEPNIAVIHANVTFISEDGKQLETPHRNIKYLSGHIFKHILLRRAHIAMATVLVRKKCFESVGLFDENLTHLGAEDREMWLRIAKQYNFKYLDEVLGYYRIRSNSSSRDVQRMVEARYYIIDKFCKNRPILKRKALAKVHQELAENLLVSKIYCESRKEYLNAFHYWPFFFKLYLGLIKTYIKVT